MTHLTVIRNKQTGPANSPEYFNFVIPGTSIHNTFLHEDWDIINTPKEGFYIWVLHDGGVEPHPSQAIRVYQGGLWRTLDRKTDSGSSSYIQGTYERGELRRLTFAEEE